jgi:hypothetical protein
VASSNTLIWENEEFSIKTPVNPHIPYSEGLHVMLAPKADYENAWQDPLVAGRAFEFAAKACKILESLDMAPWFNIQANGNWGLLPGAKKFFHIHIYGRNHTSTWGKPIQLPEDPDTYLNEPMPDEDIQRLVVAFKSL